MRIRLALLICLFTTQSLFAVAPQFWRVRTVEDFLGGELEGFAVTSNGELTAGPSLKKLASFTDPFVLAQVSAPNGDRFFGTGNDGKVYRLRGTDLKAIYTANDDVALGAMQAVLAANRIGQTLVTGMNGVPPALRAVKEGNLAIIVVKALAARFIDAGNRDRRAGGGATIAWRFDAHAVASNRERDRVGMGGRCRHQQYRHTYGRRLR